ncbi:MAG: DUF2079 domain-containing protein [Polyangiales bacterium]|nr:DUF2079 domain-containing protein [Myxococcales bacterium]
MSRREQGLAFALLGVVGIVLAELAYARYAAYHNGTFDLALYARMSWGFIHGSFWDPVTGATFAGVHLAFVQMPLALVGTLVGYVRALVYAQALFAAFAVWPLMKMAERRFGRLGAWAVLVAWLAYPNLWHVATDEYHPGTCAILPLAFAVEALDRGARRAFLGWSLAVLACREDLALVTAMLGVAGLVGSPRIGRTGLRVAAISAAYFALFVLVLVPVFGPKEGSLELHFGKWGGSMAGVAVGLVTRPGEVLAHVFAPERLRYLALLFAPLLGLPLLAPRRLLPALPLLAINLLSSWPTAITLDSHYQTTMLPVLFSAAIVGAEFVAARWVPASVVLGALVLATVTAHLLLGGSPISRDWDPSIFRADAENHFADRAVRRIPDGASVQAPYALMPHLVERMFIRKRPPPDRNTDWVILHGWHRERFLHHENLLRSEEEPVFRQWLGRDDYGLVAVDGPFYTIARGANVREGIGQAYLRGVAFPEDGVRIAACLRVRGARIDTLAPGRRTPEPGDAGRVPAATLTFSFVATGPCPNDLAVRIGSAWHPDRVDLLFDGRLMPSRLERGDLLVSRHALTADEAQDLREHHLRIGALRTSGAKPEHDDPVSVHVPLGRLW